jgi:hypothetical protein
VDTPISVRRPVALAQDVRRVAWFDRVCDRGSVSWPQVGVARAVGDAA